MRAHARGKQEFYNKVDIKRTLDKRGKPRKQRLTLRCRLEKEDIFPLFQAKYPLLSSFFLHKLDNRITMMYNARVVNGENSCSYIIVIEVVRSPNTRSFYFFMPLFFVFCNLNIIKIIGTFVFFVNFGSISHFFYFVIFVPYFHGKLF